MPEIIITMRIELVNATEAGAPVDRERLRQLCENISQFSSARDSFETALSEAGIDYDELSLVVPEVQPYELNADVVAAATLSPAALVDAANEAVALNDEPS